MGRALTRQGKDSPLSFEGGVGEVAEISELDD